MEFRILGPLEVVEDGHQVPLGGSKQRALLASLLLHVNEGLTYKQIAERQGLTYRVILRDLTRAYSQLRMQLKQDDLGDMENR